MANASTPAKRSRTIIEKVWDNHVVAQRGEPLPSFISTFISYMR